MTELRAFRALRFDPNRVELDRVIAPPYDVVTAAERELLYARDPHNAVRLELTRDEAAQASTDYADVARALAAWQAEGILRRDPRPALYALRQRFRGPDGESLVRDGFFALVRLEEYARRVVLPHERTLAAPKADRLKLLRAARANLSSVFLLYEDREQELAPRIDTALSGAPTVRARDDTGVEHMLAPIEARAEIRAVQEFLAKRPVVIADGHHRYETALAYRDEQRAAASRIDPEAPFEWVLAYFANAFAPGSLLLPIHRVVRRGPAPDAETWAAKLPGWRCREVALAGPDALPRVLAAELAPRPGEHVFAADDGSGRLRVFARPAASADGAPELLVRVLHREVLEGVFGLDERAVREGAVEFPKNATEAAKRVRTGHGSVALYLTPLDPADVFRVTARGELLPQKSTFFTPKLPTGLVFRPLDAPSAV